MARYTYTGKTALITGASGGIGEAIAHALAARGCDVILTARSQDKLEAAAQAIRTKYAVSVTVIVADLSVPGAAAALYEDIKRRALPVDLLINNAGFGVYGRFHETEWQKESAEINVDIAALVELSHRFLPHMAERRNGIVVNVSSVAGFVPLPYMASYSACKAFVLSFSQALWQEYRNQGVHVMALCPGPTKTAFFDAAGSDPTVFGDGRSAEQVAASMMRGLDKGAAVVVDGWRNRLFTTAARFLPRRAVLSSVAARLKPPVRRP